MAYDPVSIALISAMGLAALAFLWLFGSEAREAFNTAFLPQLRAAGSVTDIQFAPEHSEEYFDAALKMPRTRTVPDTWHLSIDTSAGSGSMTIHHPPADWQSEGKTVQVDYKKPRLGGPIEIVEISA